jgi:hypothetical protein
MFVASDYEILLLETKCINNHGYGSPIHEADDLRRA